MGHILGCLTIDLYQLIANLKPSILGCWTIYSHPQDKERHTVKLATSTNAEPKAFHPPL